MRKIFLLAAVAIFAFPVIGSAKSVFNRAGAAGKGGGSSGGGTSLSTTSVVGLLAWIGNSSTTQITTQNSFSTIAAIIIPSTGTPYSVTYSTMDNSIILSSAAAYMAAIDVTLVSASSGAIFQFSLLDQNSIEYPQFRFSIQIASGGTTYSGSAVAISTFVANQKLTPKLRCTNFTLSSATIQSFSFSITSLGGATGAQGPQGNVLDNTSSLTISTLTVTSSATFNGGISISGTGPSVFSGNGTSITVTNGGTGANLSSFTVNSSGVQIWETLAVSNFASFYSSSPLELGKDFEFVNFSSAVVSFASMTSFGKVVFDGGGSSSTFLIMSFHVPRLAGSAWNVTLSTFQTVSTGAITTADTENYQISICTSVVNGSSVTATSLVFIDTVQVSINPVVGGTSVINGVSNVILTGWNTDLGTGDFDCYLRINRITDTSDKQSWLRYGRIYFIAKTQ